MYQALYRKYRPQTFDDVVGQGSITETLKTQVASGRLSHAYLFTGSRGTGKTSCAKILAKAVNCLEPVGGNPCNHCAACRAIDDGACMDVLEIDAASNSGVDNVRALRDDAVYTPSEVKKRVYIIDEVHMLSIAAFNALLKTIEEPPEHLLFILATTELHKVPVTILSRCQRFSFRRLQPEDIAGRINYVADQEGVSIDRSAIRLLSQLADGALRDGLSLLDQCASACDGTLTAQTVSQCLGLAGSRSLHEMLGAIASHDAKKALSLFSQLYAEGKDVAALLDELTGLSRDLLILKTAPGSGIGLVSGACTPQELETLLPQFTSEELLRNTRILQQTSAGFSRSVSRRMDAELCLIQLCKPDLDTDTSSLSARMSRLEAKLAGGYIVPEQEPAQEPVPKAQETEQVPPVAETVQEPVQTQPSPGFWAELVRLVKEELNPATGAFFQTAPDSPIQGQMQGDTLLLVAGDNMARAIVDKKAVLDTVRQQAARLIGRPIDVKVKAKSDLAAGSGDKMASLLQFGKEHPDIIHINQK